MIWQIKTLDELGFVARGKSKHRPRGDKKLYGGKYPLIQTGDIQKTDFYISEYTNTYNDVGLAQSKLWKKGTLCLSIVGANTAESAILGFDACFPDSVIGFIANPEMSNEIFIKYYFDTMKLQMRKISDGGARENLSMEKLFTFKIPTPPVIIQNKIASILSSYDELIENNKQRIKLLEEMAEEIYKEWFVRLRFPGYENSKILNGLPYGWEKVRLDDYIKFEKGIEPGSDNYCNEKIDNNYISFLRVGDLGSRDNCVFVHKDLLKDKILNTDDIAITLDGSVGLVAMNLSGGFSSGVRKIVFKNKNLKRSFIYQTLLSENIQSTIKSHAAGTTILHAGSSINFMKILLPDKIILDKFEEVVNPIIEEILILKGKTQILQETRNLLLPRLISGKLSVNHLVEEELLMVAEPRAEYQNK